MYAIALGKQSVRQEQAAGFQPRGDLVEDVAVKGTRQMAEGIERHRLLHHAVVIVTEGESYRMREAKTRGSRTNKSA